MTPSHASAGCCPGPHRRAFLADLGLGFTGLALAAMLHQDGYASSDGTWAPPNGKPHFTPKAKSVIWLFMNGGVSHLETFDPKPELDKYAGTLIFVSHDRIFVSGLATRVIEVRNDGTLTDYLGTYDEYLESQGIDG